MNSRDYLAHPLSRSNFTYRTASKRLVFTAVRDAEGTASLWGPVPRERKRLGGEPGGNFLSSSVCPKTHTHLACYRELDGCCCLSLYSQAVKIRTVTYRNQTKFDSALAG